MSKEVKTKKVEQQLAIGDDVWNRVVQIIQEGMLMGVDVTDLMRQIRVCFWDADEGTVHLTKSYIQQVKDGHKRMVAEAAELKAKKEDSKVINLSILDGGKADE
jgi:hypothetical protein